MPIQFMENRYLWLKRLAVLVIMLLLGIVTYHTYLVSRSVHPPTLRIGIEKNPGSLDPVTGTSIEAHFVLTQVYERLVRANPDGTVTGALASTWTPLKDSPGYEFVIRPGARFSDGSPVTAEDVARTLRKIIRSRQILHTKWIVGSEPYRLGQSEHVPGLEVVDASRIRIRLTRHDERFLRDLWNSQCSIMQGAKPEAIALGSGPYKVAHYDTTVGRIELTRNPYYDGHLPDFAAVTVSAEPGDYDLSFVKPTAGLHRFVTTKYFDPEMYYLGFNTVNPRVASLVERKRLAALVSDDLIEPYFPNRHYKVGGVVPIGVFGYSPDLGVPPLVKDDPNAARYIREPILLTSYQPRLRELSQVYCAKLTHMGTPCKVVETDVRGIDEAKHNNSLQIFFGRIKTSIPEAETSLSTFSSGHPLNRFTSGSGPLDLRIEEALVAAGEIPIHQKSVLLEKVREVDQIITFNLLVKPFAYGGAREIWHLPSVGLPALDMAGMVDLDLREVHKLD